MTRRTTRRSLVAASAATVLGAPFVARAAGTERRWRCVTSWSRNMVGPGVSARRLAESITLMSNRELVVDVFAAGELVPALQVFDAVAAGTVEMAHTAAVFWGGKMPVAPMFTTVPFGLAPDAHMGWLAAGGQALWDELYAPHGVRAFVAGNTGPSSAGWFRREIRKSADLKGLRIRATGLGAKVYAALGATPIAIPPTDTYAALERGVIDAVELLAPANDLPAGLDRIARHLVLPGFNKPNGPSELLVGETAWQSLPRHLQAIIENACRAEHDRALAETVASNATALAQLTGSGVTIHWLTKDVLADARSAADAVLARVASSSALAERIMAHQKAYTASTLAWQNALVFGRLSLGR